MAYRPENVQPSCTVTTPESGQPANVVLETATAKLCVNIHAIQGSVSVGHNNSLQYVDSRLPGDDTSSSDSDSDSDIDEFCAKHFLPNPKTMRGQMKNLNLSGCKTVILTAGGEPLFLNKQGQRVTPKSGQGSSRTSASPGSAHGRNEAQYTSTRNTAQTRAPTTRRAQQQGNSRPFTAQSMPTATPQSQYSVRTNAPPTQAKATTHTRSQTAGFTRTSPQAGNTVFEEKDDRVNRMLKNLPEPYRKVDETLIRMIMPHFGNGWRRVFRFLSISDDQIDIIFQEHEKDGVSEVIYRLLLQWTRQYEEPLVWVLAKAIANADLYHIIPHLTVSSMDAITQ